MYRHHRFNYSLNLYGIHTSIESRIVYTNNAHKRVYTNAHKRVYSLYRIHYCINKDIRVHDMYNYICV